VDNRVSLADYRSFLNASSIPILSDSKRISGKVINGYHYSLTIAAEPGNAEAKLVDILASGVAAPQDSAPLDSLTTPPPKGSGNGVQLLTVNGVPGVGISLDNARMKNVVIRNAIIFLTGTIARTKSNQLPSAVT
jgi:hypothetical protein